jgi:hypothetical protein
MSFLHHALLFGTLTAVIPVLFHLALHQRPRRVELPTARFVERAVRRTRARRQLHNLLLSPPSRSRSAVRSGTTARSAVPAAAQ